MKVAPGISVNLSKSGASLSMGPRGAKVTVGKRGVRKTVGAPGTGLFYTAHESWSGKKGGRRVSRRGGVDAPPPVPRVPAAGRLRIGFFKRLFTPEHEKAFVDGCRALALGDHQEAMERLVEAASIHPDAAFIAGTLELRAERYHEAAFHLQQALSGGRRLGGLLAKYEIDAVVSIPIAEGISAVIGPRPRGVRLALAEAHQALGRWDEVVEDLEKLKRSNPDDVVVRLSLAEILLDCKSDDSGALEGVIRLAKGIRNESPVHGALLLQKAKALRRLGMPTGARDVLSPTLRRRKGRPSGLLNALRYERALAYEEMGRRSNARRDLERVYADDPDFEDVAERLTAEAA